MAYIPLENMRVSSEESNSGSLRSAELVPGRCVHWGWVCTTSTPKLSILTADHKQLLESFAITYF